MSDKKIYIKPRDQSSQIFKWYESGLIRSDAGQGFDIGKAKNLEDAVAICKVNAGGSNHTVEIKDA
jgi:hypothetical protein